MDTYTAQELALALGVTRQAISKRAVAESWPVAGQRPGRGGGKLYALAGLPLEVREAIRRHEQKEVLENAVAPYTLPAPRREEKPLKDWQRDVRDARLAIMQAVEQLRGVCGGVLAAEREFAARAKAGEVSEFLRQCVLVANARAGKQRVIEPGTLRLWRRILKAAGPDGLAPKPPRNREEEVPGWLGHFCKLYCVAGRPSINQCYEALQEAGVRLPHRRSVERAIKRIVGPVELHRGRLGPREWKKMKAYSKRRFDSLLPGDVYSADGHKADLVVQHPEHGQPVRPEIISVLDIATRRCVGWSAEIFEHGYLVADAVRCAVEWGRYPGHLVRGQRLRLQERISGRDGGGNAAAPGDHAEA